MSDLGLFFTPEQIRAHLQRGQRWTRSEETTTELWSWQGDDRQITIALPRQEVTGEGDNSEAAIRALAFAERRSVEQLAADLSFTGGADTLSIRLVGDDALPGSIRAGELQRSITAACDLIQGSASALTNPNAVLSSRHPVSVDQYLASIRVITSPGSFVVTLALPMNLDGGLDDDGETLPLFPSNAASYGEQVVRRMRSVLAGSIDLADQVLAGEASLGKFAERPDRTGNVTELEALARLGGAIPEENSNWNQYRLHLSSGRLSAGEPVAVSAPPGRQQIFWQAAEYLRTREPLMDVTLTGAIVRLVREGGLGPGEVSIYGELDGVPRHVWVSLSESEYSEAVRAHNEARIVQVTGDVSFAHTRARLSAPLGFTVLPNLS